MAPGYAYTIMTAVIVWSLLLPRVYIQYHEYRAQHEAFLEESARISADIAESMARMDVLRARSDYLDQLGRADAANARLDARYVARFRTLRPEAYQDYYPEADARARALLKDVLTDEQWRQYETRGHFDVEGSHGHTYRIMRRSTSNVIRMRRLGAVLQPHSSWCAIIGDYGVPLEDQLVTQKLMIETNEKLFLQSAIMS